MAKNFDDAVISICSLVKPLPSTNKTNINGVTYWCSCNRMPKTGIYCLSYMLSYVYRGITLSVIHVYKHKELDLKLGHSEIAGKKDRGLALFLFRENRLTFLT